METDELKAEVDKFLQKLQQSIVKPAGSTPTAKSKEVSSDPEPPWVTPQPVKLKPKAHANFLKPKTGEPKMKSGFTDAFTGKPIPSEEVTISAEHPNGEYTVFSEAEPVGEEGGVEATTDDFYNMLLNLVNLLVESIEHPPLSIHLLLKNGKYELSDLLTPLALPASKAEEGAMGAKEAPLIFSQFLEIGLSQALTDILLQLIPAITKPKPKPKAKAKAKLKKAKPKQKQKPKTKVKDV